MKPFKIRHLVRRLSICHYARHVHFALQFPQLCMHPKIVQHPQTISTPLPVLITKKLYPFQTLDDSRRPLYIQVPRHILDLFVDQKRFQISLVRVRPYIPPFIHFTGPSFPPEQYFHLRSVGVYGSNTSYGS